VAARDHDAPRVNGDAKGRSRDATLETGSLPRHDLLSSVCHDLKDPLASIVMGAGFLRRVLPESEATASARRVVDAIQRSADRLSRVVGDFSDLGKIAQGTLVLHPASHAVAEMTRSAFETSKALVAGTEIELALRVAPEAEAARLRCDRARVEQTIVTLCAAALRLAPERAKIELAVATTPDGGARFEITVARESAGGMAPQRPDGAKLGLALAKGLVELHGGEISASSTGDTSSFCASFPGDSPPKPAQQKRSRRRKDATAASRGAAFLAQRTMKREH